MVNSDSHRSTADVRRRQVLSAATALFARSGYRATTIEDVAQATGISQGYVMRLFETKLALFVAVVDDCNERVRAAVAGAADHVPNGPPDAVLDAMYGAYADLMADRNLIMVQVHAQASSDIPEIRDAVRRGLAKLVDSVRERSGATDAQVKRIVAFAMLCQLIVAVDLQDISVPWARTLTDGIRQPEGLLTQADEDQE